jgi:hypothetical protein
MPHLLNDLVNRLDRQVMDSEWLQRFSITAQEGREALDAFVAFMRTAVDPDVRDMRSASDVSGFSVLKRNVKDAVLALFGSTCLGASWAGCRDAAIVGPSPLLSMRRRGAEALAEVYGGVPTKLLADGPAETIPVVASSQEVGSVSPQLSECPSVDREKNRKIGRLPGN